MTPGKIEPGRMLLHYRIVEKIGEGGMGVVWLAEDTRLDRKVALKFLPEDVAADPERRARFEQEAKSVAALNHPNIVTVHSVEEAPGEDARPFITMEFVEGRALSKEILRDGLPAERFFEIALPLADALAAAHERGITHRDLKPDNIMVGRDGRVRVLDFGLAKARPEPPADGVPQDAAPTATVTPTHGGVIFGTVPYMSPEQAEGKPVDHRTDIFSIGVILYQMATGRRPFGGDTDTAVISSILKDTPPPILDLNARMPRHLGRIVRRCLEKDPDRRYQRARDLHHELEDLETEVRSNDISVSRPVGVTPEPPKRKTLTGVAVVLVLVAIGVGAAVLPRLIGPKGGGETAAGQDPLTTGAVAPKVLKASIAVLPFVNMSPDPEDEYFSDGMTEELINALVKVKGLHVPARTSVFAFKGKNAPVGEIAEALKVASVLEGSVRRSGDRLRVTAQLVNADDGFHVWSEVYERSTEDVFAIQDDITRSIVRSLEKHLDVGEEVIPPEPKRPRNLEAYDHYLRGRQLITYYGKERMEAALGHFERALSIDPEYAQAWVGVATCWMNLANRHYPPLEAMPKSREAAEKALALDDSLAEGHAVLGFINLFFEWDFEESERRFRRALELNPGDALVHLYYGSYLLAMNRIDEGKEEILRAVGMDPLSAYLVGRAAMQFLMASDFEESMRQGRRHNELAPDGAAGHVAIGHSLVQLGRYDEALDAFREAIERDDSPKFLAWLAQGYALSGDRATAETLLVDLLELSRTKYVCPYETALAYLALERDDKVSEYLDKAYEARADCLAWGNVDPRWAELREADEHFRDLLRRVGHDVD